MGIDNELVVATSDAMVELSNGCLCCSINGELQEAVQRVLERPDPLDLIVVETTGLADPLPVVLTFSATALASPIARAQVVCGDFLLLNRCDLVDGQRVGSSNAAG